MIHPCDNWEVKEKENKEESTNSIIDSIRTLAVFCLGIGLEGVGKDLIEKGCQN